MLSVGWLIAAVAFETASWLSVLIAAVIGAVVTLAALRGEPHTSRN